MQAKTSGRHEESIWLRKISVLINVLINFNDKLQFIPPN